MATVTNPGKHLRSFAERIASDQEVAGRHLVGLWTFVKVASRLIGNNATLGTPDDLVAETIGCVPVVAVRDDLRHRRLLWPLDFVCLDNDPHTGKRAWRLYTIPWPGDPDNGTWAGDSWRTGGAPTWITGSYDPELNLVYWGTGNPGPDWNGEVRLGDNLYSDSALAVDADTGKLAWYFQFTPWDVHDWDAIQVPILAELELNGEPRKVMMWANRNAFYYTLDRETGEFLVGTRMRSRPGRRVSMRTAGPSERPGNSPRPTATSCRRR